MLRIEYNENLMTVFLEGRIDSANAPELEGSLEKALAANPGKDLQLDAGHLKYISSAGLRVLLQMTKRLGHPLSVLNVSPEVYEILDITGFTEILRVRKKMREISVEGCEVIGIGGMGTVYRLDEDTIVKVYDLPDSLPIIENGQKQAKRAFLKGIPTAISYDVVKVGDKFGIVFEMLKASTYNDLLRRHPEEMDRIVRRFTHFMHKLHTVKFEKGTLPDARNIFTAYLDQLRDLLGTDLYDRLRSLLEAMPEDLHMIHGDLQMKNVMLNNGKSMLIDMDTLSTGDPIFDLMGLYVTYVIFPQDEADNCQKFLGISNEMAGEVWETIFDCYFDGVDAAAQEEAKIRIGIAARIRFLYIVAVLNIGTPEYKEIRIRHSLADLRDLAWKTDSLSIRKFMRSSAAQSVAS